MLESMAFQYQYTIRYYLIPLSIFKAVRILAKLLTRDHALIMSFPQYIKSCAQVATTLLSCDYNIIIWAMRPIICNLQI